MQNTSSIMYLFQNTTFFIELLFELKIWLSRNDININDKICDSDEPMAKPSVWVLNLVLI